MREWKERRTRGALWASRYLDSASVLADGCTSKDSSSNRGRWEKDVERGGGEARKRVGGSSEKMHERLTDVEVLTPYTSLDGSM